MKLIEVIASTGSAQTIASIARKYKAFDFRVEPPNEDGTQVMRFVVSDDRVQGVLDASQTVLGAQPYARVLVFPVEVSLPKQPDEERKRERGYRHDRSRGAV